MSTLSALRKALARPVLGSTSPKRRRKEQGVALILVITSIAILLSVAVDFQYNSSVDLKLAANARDELRAEYLARSAVNLSRVLLRFQKQVDAQSGMVGQMLGGLLGQQNAQTAGSLSIRLWEMVPLDCESFGMLLGGGGSFSEDSGSEAPAFGDDEDSAALAAAKPKSTSFGDFSGCFQAEISDEEQKINLNRLDLGAINGLAPMIQAYALLNDPKLEFVFEKPDANGVKMNSQDVLIALHDWIDQRDTQASLNLTGSGEPFTDGFGDENRNYSSRYPNRYRSKNARFDTLDELYQVDGVSDLFMAAFRDRMTVYPDKNAKLNINTNDPLQQLVNIASIAANPNDPKLMDPMVIATVNQQIALSKMMFPFLGLSVQQFASIVEGAGIQVRPEAKMAAAQNKFVQDKSSTFTVKATGQAGDVEKTVTAVVEYNDQLGKLLYYRIE